MEAKYYYKSELAMAYFPDSVCEVESSVRRLTRWIKNAPGLTEALRAVGYLPRQKHFSKVQTEVIFEYLGEP